MIVNVSNKPIFVTGIERSGSSIVGRILCLCNVFSGALTNMFENQEIRTRLIDIYEKFNADPKGQYPLPDPIKIQNGISATHFKMKLERILCRQGYVEGVWFFKSFRLLHLWPLFHKMYPEAKWIIVRRRTGDIINSCTKTAYMEAFEKDEVQKMVGVSSAKDGWLYWVHEQEKLINQAIEAGIDYKVIWPERIINYDYSQLMEVLDWVGVEGNEIELHSILNPILHKMKVDINKIRYGKNNSN